jgi:hypothetical protein
LPLAKQTVNPCEVTLYGTGFNPDKTKDTVMIAYPGAGAGLPATITSATASQLKIIAPVDSLLVNHQCG